MRVVAVGSVALDTIHARGAAHADLLGGSASYFGLASIHFGPVGLVAVVGEDFPAAELTRLRDRGIDLQGLEQQAGRTFRWEGAYAADLKERRTLRTEEGVFAGFRPRLPEVYRRASALFLANIDPDLQLEVLSQAGSVPLIALDTMNYWITSKPSVLRSVIGKVHLLLINDEEAALLTGFTPLVDAIEALRGMGPPVIVVKKGPHGVLARGPWGWLALPALPVSGVTDPTGAGDSFAGGLVGFLAGGSWRERDAFAQALAMGTAVASLVVEDWGVDRLAQDRSAEIWARCGQLREMTRFDVPRRS